MNTKGRRPTTPALVIRSLAVLAVIGALTASAAAADTGRQGHAPAHPTTVSGVRAFAAATVLPASMRGRGRTPAPAVSSLPQPAAVWVTDANTPDALRTVFPLGLPRLYCWVRNSALPLHATAVTFTWARDQPYGLIDQFTLARSAGAYTGAYETAAASAPGRFGCAVAVQGKTVGTAHYTVESTASAVPPAPMAHPQAESSGASRQTRLSTVSVFAVGDSVMLDAAADLESHGISVDAAVSRQWYEGIDILSAMGASGRLPGVVIVGLSTNGPISDALFDQMMGVLRGVRRVVFVTVRVPRFWQDENNSVLRVGVARWPNARLADWYAISWDQPGWFAGDGFHLSPAGATAYTQVVVDALG